MSTRAIPLFARQPGHDSGFDLIAGRDMTNKSVGNIYWDDGLVLRLDVTGREDYLPDDGADAAHYLAEHGYELDADSLAAIDALPAS